MREGSRTRSTWFKTRLSPLDHREALLDQCIADPRSPRTLPDRYAPKILERAKQLRGLSLALHLAGA